MGTKTYSENAIEQHLLFLKEKIFQVATRWPHFNRLINDLQKIASQTLSQETVVILERSYIYGGDSLFAPIFQNCNLISVDCQILTAEERGAYQKDWINDKRFIRVSSNHKAPITNTGLSDGLADILIIPNVVHHVRDQDGMFKEFSRLLKHGGKGYIFEALLRELHQEPDDFVRYTPWGFEYMLEKYGLIFSSHTSVGGPFEAISYCWDQALQYIPDHEEEGLKKWFKERHFDQLLKLDQKYNVNLKRKHTSFPLGYGIFFTKVNKI